MRRHALRMLRVIVAVGLVAFVVYKADIGRLGAGRMSWGTAAAALAIVPFALLLRAYSLSLLLNRPRHVLGMRDAYALTLVGAGIGLLMPAGAADLAKAHWGLRTHGHAEAMVVSTVLDKLTSLSALALTGAAGALLAGLPLLAAGVGLLGVVVLLPLALPSTAGWRLLLRFLAPGMATDPELIRTCARPPAWLLAWLVVVSAAGWMLTYAVTWLSCLAVSADVSIATVLAFAPLSTLARLIPVSVAGIGVGEVTLAALLTGAGVAPAEAARAVLLTMVLLVLLPGAAGAAILARGKPARS